MGGRVKRAVTAETVYDEFTGLAGLLTNSYQFNNV
jgi:hypothetical protein